MNLSVPPDFLAGMTDFDGETVVGFRALTESATTEPCRDGCLAPGSSPHFHSVVTGYQLVTTTGLYEFNPAGMCVRSSMLHPTVLP